MKFSKTSLKNWYDKHRWQFFFAFYMWILLDLIMIAKMSNTLLDKYWYISLVLDSVSINKTSVIVAPIVEEIIKFAGYGVILFVDFNVMFKLGYNSKKEFIEHNIPIFFILSAGIFGLQEGIEHNAGFCIYCLWGFVFLNALIHITYSIYPYIFGRKYANRFIYFLPIAMLLHSVHNFMIDTVWDNKWVTFVMVTIFLLPLVILERKSLVNLIKGKNERRKRIFLTSIFVIIYVYIFLCCLLAF